MNAEGRSSNAPAFWFMGMRGRSASCLTAAVRRNARLEDALDLLDVGVLADRAYNDLLHYNYITFWMPGYSKEKEELYHWVYNELLEQGEELVPMAGYWEDDLWYQAITNQRYYGWGQSDPNHTDYFNHLNDSGAEYILVLKDSQIYQDEQAYFDSLERIYDTEIGFVGKLNEK